MKTFDKPKLANVSFNDLSQYDTELRASLPTPEPSSATEITLTALQALYTAGTMTAGWYYITDRKIWVEALNGNSISPNGKRLMYCPAQYGTLTDDFDNVWKGVFNPNNEYSPNDLVIWGGKVWSNDAGVTGTASDDLTLSADWNVISKDTFSNHEYVELSFGCSFDVANDWVSKQWDDKGNVHGISFAEQMATYNFPQNPVDFNDWNLSSANGVFYHDNNNIACWNNTCTYYKKGQSGIHGNTNKGVITGNVCCSIYDNSNAGSISYNVLPFTGIINSNSNNGQINYNSNTGSIYSNSNIGNINNNSNTGSIYSNSNTGSINSNSNTGTIYKNSNNGRIYSNSNNGDINNNSNNGSIDSNLSGSDPCNINSNINNGYISGTWAADVIDTPVNKT
jgi:hypothetical protein